MITLGKPRVNQTAVVQGIHNQTLAVTKCHIASRCIQCGTAKQKVGSSGKACVLNLDVQNYAVDGVFLGERLVKFNCIDQRQNRLIAGMVKLAGGLKGDTGSVDCERHVCGVVILEGSLQFQTGARVVVGTQRTAVAAA